MSIEVAKMVRAKRRARRPIRMATFSFPRTKADDLARLYLQVPRLWQEAARDRIIPTYEVTLRLTAPLHDALTRDDVPGLGAEIDAVDEGIYRLILRLKPEMRSWLIKAERLHRSKFVAASKTAFNVDLASILTEAGVSVTMQSVLERNVSLVRAVSDDIRRSIADVVFKSFTARSPIRDLAKEINEATQLGRTRSLTIARDQTTKLSATLDRERQQEIGIEQFVWVHSGKLHFRPEHKARDGKIYSWDNNDLDGDLPGVAINCGCKSAGWVPPPD